MKRTTLKEFRKKVNKFCRENPDCLNKIVILSHSGAEIEGNIYKPYGDCNQWMLKIE